MKNSIVVLMLAACVLAGCSNGVKEIESSEAEETVAASVSAVEEETKSTAEETEESEENEDMSVEGNELWVQAYLDFLKNDEDYGQNGQDSGMRFALIYLDDDEVPELFIDTGFEAGGECIVTFHDGKTIKQQLERCGSQYIEKSGLIYTNTGHMDYYPLTITKLENGQFTEIGSGLSYVSEENGKKMREDENYPYILTYEWEGKTVTEDQFNAEVAELYDLDQSKYPENFHSYDEFVKMIQDGNLG